jgi:hypothetical protein
MIEGLDWAVVYKNKIRALFVARYQAEMFIKMLHNTDEWHIERVKVGVK